MRAKHVSVVSDLESLEGHLPERMILVRPRRRRLLEAGDAHPENAPPCVFIQQSKARSSSEI